MHRLRRLTVKPIRGRRNWSKVVHGCVPIGTMHGSTGSDWLISWLKGALLIQHNTVVPWRNYGKQSEANGQVFSRNKWSFSMTMLAHTSPLKTKRPETRSVGKCWNTRHAVEIWATSLGYLWEHYRGNVSIRTMKWRMLCKPSWRINRDLSTEKEDTCCQNDGTCVTTPMAISFNFQ